MKRFITIIVLLLAGEVAHAQLQLTRLTNIAVEEYGSAGFSSIDSIYYFYSGNGYGYINTAAFDKVLRTVQNGEYRQVFCQNRGYHYYDSLFAYHHSGTSMDKAEIYEQRILNKSGNADMKIIARNLRFDGLPFISADSNYYDTDGIIVEKTENILHKYYYHYSVPPILDTLYKYNRTSSSDPWVFSGKTYYTYLKVGAGINYLLLLIDEVHTGADNYALKYIYDNYGMLTNKLKMDPLLTDTLERTTYSYNSQGYIADEVFQQDDNGKLQNLWRRISSYEPTAQMQKIEEIFLSGINDSQQWDTVKRGVYSYSLNSVTDDKPVQYETSHWDSPTQTWQYKTGSSSVDKDHRIRFQYDYFYFTGIDEQVVNNDNYQLSVYPVPSTSFINVLANFDNPQPITATITDMQGRLMRSWNEAPTKEYHSTIPVADLPAGNYVLKVNGMVKQFVVR